MGEMLFQGNSPEGDTYSRGKPARRETADGVEQMQRVLMLMRNCAYFESRVSRLALVEYIGRWFEDAGLPSPVPPIDNNPRQLAAVRANSRRALYGQFRREPDPLEVAIEVASRHRRTNESPAIEAALQQMKRLRREAEAYEYTWLDMHRVTGRRPLPPLRPPPGR